MVEGTSRSDLGLLILYSPYMCPAMNLLGQVPHCCGFVVHAESEGQHALLYSSGPGTNLRHLRPGSLNSDP